MGGEGGGRRRGQTETEVWQENKRTEKETAEGAAAAPPSPPNNTWCLYCQCLPNTCLPLLPTSLALVLSFLHSPSPLSTSSTSPSPFRFSLLYYVLFPPISSSSTFSSTSLPPFFPHGFPPSLTHSLLPSLSLPFSLHLTLY